MLRVADDRNPRIFPSLTIDPPILKYMRALAEAHRGRAFVQQVVARLPGGHVLRLLENVKDASRREWCARQAIEIRLHNPPILDLVIGAAG